MPSVIKRDESVDFAKGVGMAAVSFGHIFPTLLGSNDILTKYCFSFELAVFFIASGYLLYGRHERKPVEYIKHSAVSLLYPYVSFSILLFVFESALCIISDGFGEYAGTFAVRGVSALTWGEGAVWFLPTFFAAGVIAFFCRRIRKVNIAVPAVILMAAGSLLCMASEKYGYLKDVTDESIVTSVFWMWHILSFISRGVTGASLILIGCVIRKYKPDSKKFGIWRPIIISVLLIVGFTASSLNYDFVDFHFAFIRNPLFFYLSAVCTSLALLDVGAVFHPRFVTWCGRESLLLILAQSGIMHICLAVKKFVDVGSMRYAAVLAVSVVILVVSLAVSYVAVRIIHSSFLKIIIIPPKKKELK